MSAVTSLLLFLKNLFHTAVNEYWWVTGMRSVGIMPHCLDFISAYSQVQHSYDIVHESGPWCCNIPWMRYPSSSIQNTARWISQYTMLHRPAFFMQLLANDICLPVLACTVLWILLDSISFYHFIWTPLPSSRRRLSNDDYPEDRAVVAC